MVKETEDIYRLYRREWVTVHTVTVSGVDARPCFDAACAWVKENLEGRVRRKDINLQCNTDGGLLFWCHVQVFKENLKGEFRYRGAAEGYAHAHGYDEWVVVPRNSKSDHEIRAYGVTKL